VDEPDDAQVVDVDLIFRIEFCTIRTTQVKNAEAPPR